MSDHPAPSQIVALVHAVEPKLRRGVLTHVAGCADCAAVLSKALAEVDAAERERKMLRFGRPLPRREQPPRDGGPRPRAWWTRPRSAVSELAAAEKQLAELLREPEAKQALLVHNTDRFGGLALAELLIEQGRETCFNDAARGERMIHLGLSLVDRLDREYYGRRVLNDVAGRGWAFVANARRILEDFAGATAAHRRADELLADSPDPVELAGCMHFKSGLATDMRKFDEGLAYLAQAAELFEAAGEESKAGRAYASQGALLLNRGEPEAADVALSEALVRLDAEEDPRTLLYVRHNLVICLIELDRFDEAEEMLAQVEGDYGQFSDAHTRTRLLWVRGLIAAGKGRDEEAESCFLGARNEFIALGTPFSAASISLDLAKLLLRQGRTGELKQLAAEMVPIFFAKEIAREATMALAFFVRAVEQERATALVIKRVSGFLRRAERDPELKFSDFD